MCPWSSTYMLAPTSSGEEPSTSTSRPATTRRPSRSQSATAAAVCWTGRCISMSLVAPPASTYVDRWSLAPPGKDADPQESLWDFKWSRGEAGGERSETVQPGGDQRPPGGVRTCRRATSSAGQEGGPSARGGLPGAGPL